MLLEIQTTLVLGVESNMNVKRKEEVRKYLKMLKGL